MAVPCLLATERGICSCPKGGQIGRRFGGMRNVTQAKGRWGWVDGDDGHFASQVEKSAPKMGPLFRRKLTSSLTVRTAATGQLPKSMGFGD
jgi:hypothetical protein